MHKVNLEPFRYMMYLIRIEMDCMGRGCRRKAHTVQRGEVAGSGAVPLAPACR